MYVPRVARGPAPRPPRPRVRTARLSRRVDVSAKGRRTRRALFSFFLDAPADPSRTAAFTYSTRHVSRRHIHRVLLSRVSVRRLERARDEVRARLGLERRRADGDAVETARQASVAARGDREIKRRIHRGVAGRLGARRHKKRLHDSPRPPCAKWVCSATAKPSRPRPRGRRGWVRRRRRRRRRRRDPPAAQSTTRVVHPPRRPPRRPLRVRCRESPETPDCLATAPRRAGTRPPSATRDASLV